MTDLEGADRASQRGGVPPEQRIWKADPASQRGRVPLDMWRRAPAGAQRPKSSGFGRGGSGLPDGGGAPRGAEGPLQRRRGQRAAERGVTQKADVRGGFGVPHKSIH